MPDQISGKDAYVGSLSCITRWGMSIQANGSRYQASCTGGATISGEGNTDVTGTIEGVGLGFPFPDGTDLAAVFVTSNQSGDLLSYSGNIRINQVQVTFPVAAADPIRWTANWGAQGTLTKSTAVGGADASVSVPPTAKLITAEYGGTAVDALQALTVTFRRPEGTYIISGSTQRQNGGLEADVSFELLTKDIEAYTINSEDTFEVLNDGTVVVDFSSVRLKSLTNYQVDRETGDVIGYTVNGEFNAVTGTTLGYIQQNGSDVFGTKP